MTSVEKLSLPKVLSSDVLPLYSLNLEPAGDGNEPTDRVGANLSLPKVDVVSSWAEKSRRPVSAAIVDKSVLFRTGLMHILAGCGFRVASECSRLSDLPERVFGDEHCVALIGLDKEAEAVLPGITSLKEKHRSLRIVVLSDQLRPDQLLAVIEAGADGYLLKNEISPDALLKSLDLVLMEVVVIPQGFTKLLSSRPPLQLDAAPAVQRQEPAPECGQPGPAKDVAQTDNLDRLSSREHLVLKHLTQGSSNKYIARDLNIAEATVKVHVKSLLRKIRVANRTQAAMWAVNHAGSIDRKDLPPFDLP